MLQLVFIVLMTKNCEEGKQIFKRTQPNFMHYADSRNLLRNIPFHHVFLRFRTQTERWVLSSIAVIVTQIAKSTDNDLHLCGTQECNKFMVITAYI